MAEKVTFACADGGVVCGARITGESEDEVVRKALEHARRRHGVDLEQARTLERYVRSLVREG